jgi:alpha-tubulin suppressor-like RCC1 family protein
MSIFRNLILRNHPIILFVFFSLFIQSNSLVAQHISTGGAHSMFICPNGDIIGSGNNANGQLGTDDFIPYDGLQTLIEGEWSMVSCGSGHTLLIKSDSTLWAMGTGGRLGLGDYDDRTVPVQVGTDNDWVFVEAGVYTSFGIRNNGTLWAWGVGINGQLGLDAQSEALEPTKVGLSDIWVAVAASQEFTIGLQSDGTIWGWGLSSNGELGDETIVLRSFPEKVSLRSEWAAIETTIGGHSLALDNEGYLWGTGRNNFGQLGSPEDIYSFSEWTLLDSTNQYLSIASGKDHTLVIRNDNTLWATGRNDFGQLGIGSAENSFGFVQVGDQSNWKQVTACSSHSIGITSENELYIWGKNKDWLMPSCDMDGLYQCNQPLFIENYCGTSEGGGGTTSIIEHVSVSSMVYPVPVRSVMYFEHDETYDYVQLTDISGRMVFRAEKVNSSVDLSFLRSGIYLVEAAINDTRHQQKIIKD